MPEAEFFGAIADLVQWGRVVVGHDYHGRQAESYDLTQAWTGDLDYYRQWAERQGGPVLELACGTGRISLPLARDGVSVVGLDRSLDMLGVFKEKLAREPEPVQSRVELIHGDMTDFSLGRKFPLIIVPLYSFTHLTESRARENFFARAWRHLQPGGVLVMELPVWVEGEEWTGNHPRFSYHRRQGLNQLVSFYQTRPLAPGLVNLNFLTIHLEAEGRARVEAVACNEYRASRADLAALTATAGFKQMDLYRNYRHSPLRAKDHAAVLVARK